MAFRQVGKQIKTKPDDCFPSETLKLQSKTKLGITGTLVSAKLMFRLQKTHVEVLPFFKRS